MLSTSQSPSGQRRGVGIFAILLVGAIGASCGDSAQLASARPNIVLVVIDTLRPDHLPAYGYERDTAPFLTDLAERSVVFERAFSTSSWTAPSTASIFTGLYPNQHGVVAGFKMQRKQGDSEDRRTIRLVSLPETLETLPELLRAAGYRTFGVSANINIGAELGFTRGFDQFERMHKDDGRDLVERVLSWRDELEAAGPSFLYLHFNDVHKPYRAREPWYEEQEDPLSTWIAKYDSEIRHLDGALAELAQELEWGRETVILLVSDHGEEFMDHGDWGHKFSLHYELNRVLMMLHAPLLAEASGRVASNVGLVDVLPTLLEVAQVSPAAGAPGRSVLALAAGREVEFFDQRTLFAHRRKSSGEHLWAAIQGDWKMIDNPGAETSMLFDIHADPAELDDLATARADIAAEFKARLDQFRELFPIPEGQVVEVDVDDELLEHLQNLGYVDGK